MIATAGDLDLGYVEEDLAIDAEHNELIVQRRLTSLPEPFDEAIARFQRAHLAAVPAGTVRHD